jgi:GNAT superfamily N-acetyltransferase
LTATPERAPVVSLRPITAADGDFLRLVYAATREEELALVDWDDDQKAAFLEMQFTAQHAYYQEQFPQGSFDVIIVDDRPAGRLYVDRSPEEILVIDIALLPEFRGRGVGTEFLGRVLDEARTLGLPVAIHVERNNPALRWYGRLGFVLVEDRGVYLFLRWGPEPSSAGHGEA